MKEIETQSELEKAQIYLHYNDFLKINKIRQDTQMLPDRIYPIRREWRDILPQDIKDSMTGDSN